MQERGKVQARNLGLDPGLPGLDPLFLRARAGGAGESRGGQAQPSSFPGQEEPGRHAHLGSRRVQERMASETC